MNLQRVSRYEGKEIRLICISCNKWTQDESCFANLDGEAFKDFYCEICAAQVLTKNNNVLDEEEDTYHKWDCQ